MMEFGPTAGGQILRSLGKIEGELVEIRKLGERVSKLEFRSLRESCPCAACIDEDTGKLILDIVAIPEDIHPTAIGFSGNYALKIGWSDGHHTGLFTWDYLDELSTRWEQNNS